MFFMIIEVKWPWTFFDTLGSITNKLKSCHKKHLEDWFVLAIDRKGEDAFKMTTQSSSCKSTTLTG
jgi:hypothetical protein